MPPGDGVGGAEAGMKELGNPLIRQLHHYATCILLRNASFIALHHTQMETNGINVMRRFVEPP